MLTRVYLRSPILRTGLVLADLPGKAFLSGPVSRGSE
jgi:hypothetical protein